MEPTAEPAQVVVVEEERGRETAVTPTRSITPSTTPTYIPIPTATDDDIEDSQEMRNESPLPSATPAPPTKSPTPVPSTVLPSPTIAIWTGIGTPMPMASEAISPENITRLQELGRWGKGYVIDALYSPDGKELAVATALGVYFYDAETVQQLRFIPAERELVAFSISDDWQLLALGFGWPGGIEIRAIDGALLQTIETENRVGRMTFTSGNEVLIAGVYNAGTMGWRVHDGMQLDTLPPNYVQSTLVEEGKTAVTFTDFQLQLWQLTNGLVEEVPSSIVLDRDIGVIQVSQDGQLLAVGEYGGLRVWVWRLSDQTLLYTLDTTPPETVTNSKHALSKPVSRSGPGHYYINDLEFSPDGQTLSVTNGFLELTMWNMDNGELQKRIIDAGLNVIYAPDGQRLATWMYTLSQRLSEDGSVINILTQHIGSVTSLVFMPVGQNLAIGSYDRSIYLRRVSDGSLYKRFYSNEGGITALDVTSSGATLVSGSADRTVRFWNLEDDSSVGTTTGGWGYEVEHISISHDNQYAISSITDGALALWQIESGILLELGFGFGATALQPVVFSPIEMVFATMEDEKSLGLWSNFDVFAEPQQLLSGPADFWARSLAYSPDGKMLAAGSSRGQLWVWRISDGALLLQLDDAFSENTVIEQVGFSPDGNLLAAISWNKIFLWDFSKGELLHTIDAQYGFLNDIAFSPDGRYLAVGSSVGAVRIWGVP